MDGSQVCVWDGINGWVPENFQKGFQNTRNMTKAEKSTNDVAVKSGSSFSLAN